MNKGVYFIKEMEASTGTSFDNQVPVIRINTCGVDFSGWWIVNIIWLGAFEAFGS